MIEEEIEEQDLSKFNADFLEAKYWKLVSDLGYGNPNTGICLSIGCDYTTDEIEPDETSKYCEVCHKNTVCAWLYLVPLDGSKTQLKGEYK